mgnify:CR=1 FL=1
MTSRSSIKQQIQRVREQAIVVAVNRLLATKGYDAMTVDEVAAEAGMAKWWGPKLAYDAIHQCLLCYGHGGYDRGLMEQRLRDVLGFQIGDGTAQIMKTIIARVRAGRKFVPA